VTAHCDDNLLGRQLLSCADPLRDVLISLLANVAAWALGVFVAMVAHDADPEFMEATVDYQRVSRHYVAYRSTADHDIESITARFARRIEQKRNAAQARSRDVERERRLLLQVREHERHVVSACTSALRGSIEYYRDVLVKMAASRQGGLIIVRADGEILPPYEWRNTPLLLDPDFVRGLH
jgi:hypothetical protein